MYVLTMCVCRLIYKDRVYVCTCTACMYVYVLCMYVCMYVCMYIKYIIIHASHSTILYVCVYTLQMYVCMYVCI